MDLGLISFSNPSGMNEIPRFWIWSISDVNKETDCPSAPASRKLVVVSDAIMPDSVRPSFSNTA